MVNETDQYSNADYLRSVQYAARELAVPAFNPPQEVRGGNTRPLRTARYSLDGAKVATGCDMRGLRVWDVREKMDAATSYAVPTGSDKSGGDKLSPHGGHVASIAWSPAQGNIMATGCKASVNSTCLAIWDVKKPYKPLFKHSLSADILSMTFHPSGDHLAVVCQGKVEDEAFFFCRREGADGRGKWEMRRDVGIGGVGGYFGSEEINALEFSHSGKFLLSVSNDGSLSAWAYPTEPRDINAIASASRAVVAGTNGTGKDTATVEAGAGTRSAVGTPARSDSPPSSPLPTTTGGIAADDTNANANANADGDVDVDMSDPTSPTGLVPPLTSSSSRSKSNSKSTSTLSTSASNGTATTTAGSTTTAGTGTTFTSRELGKARQLHRIKHSIVHSASLLAMGIDPLGRYVAVGGQDALLSLFTMRDWICTRTFDCGTAAIRYIAFSSDGELIAYGGDDPCIIIVSVVSGQVVDRIPFQGSLTSLAWHPTKNSLAYVLSSKGPVVWYVVQQSKA